MLRTLINCLILISLSGCALFTETVRVRDPVYLSIHCQTPSKVVGVNPLPTDPIAIQDTQRFWWIGFTPKHYENLAINTAEIIRYIKSKKSEVRYYKSCITDFNKEIEVLKNEPK